MRKLVGGFAASLDGYIEGPNGEYDWILIDKEIDFSEMAKRFDAYLYGRASYESVKKMGLGGPAGISHYVYSTTLSEVDEPFRLVRGDIFEQVKSLKEVPGKDIAVFGGASLLSSLLDLGLVDEISISFIPVLLGEGKPMVRRLNKKVPMNLLSTRTYSNGTIVAVYKVGTKKSPMTGDLVM